MSAFGSTKFEISHPSGACAATGRPIEIGQEFVAALAERDGEEALERLDFSIESWDGGARPQPPLKLFGFWRGQMPEPNSKKPMFVDDESLVDLFEQLAGEDDERKVVFRFILGLILVRRKLMRYERAAKGKMVLRWTKASGGGEEPVEVIDPGMTEGAISLAAEQVGAIMFGDSDQNGAGS